MHSNRRRLHPALYVGLQRYFLTFCTSNRRRHFESSEPVDLVLAQILRTALEFDMRINVYCVMPDHVHALAEGCTEQADMIRFVHQAKQQSGFAFAARYGQRLWQPSYYDHVLRDDEASVSVARYIIENPVRAGLVQSPRQYPYIGSTVYTIDEILEAVCWQP
jgi:REP-associated tyrosine transposase